MSRQLVHVLVPAGLDDPARPSGGNVYGRRLMDELPAAGWTVREHPVAGGWPTPWPSDRAHLTALLSGLPDGSVVLVDGLIASAAEELVPATPRLRVVVLLHMPVGGPIERVVLRAAAGVVATSRWTREHIVADHDLDPTRVSVAHPGVDRVSPAERTAGERTADGGRLLCVGPVTAAKGQDVLVEALRLLADLNWRCTVVGSLDLDRRFVADLQAREAEAGLTDRLVFTGALTTTELDELRRRTDLTVAPSLRESYGMAVAEGLARAIPAVITDVGGHLEALGGTAEARPGGLVQPGDPATLADALHSWLVDPDCRRRWRAAADRRRDELSGWAQTAACVAAHLAEI